MNSTLHFVAPALIPLAILACITLWIQAGKRLAAGQPLLPAEPSPVVPWGLLDVVMALLLQLAMIQVAAVGLERLWGINVAAGIAELDIHSRAVVMLASAGAYFVACLLALAWLVLRHRTPPRELGFVWETAFRDLVLGLSAFAMLAPLVYGLQLVLVQLIKSEHPLIELLKENPSPRFFAISGTAAVLVAPLAEEFFYRLLLQGWLERAAAGGEPPRAIFLGGRPAGPPESATDAADASPAAAPPTPPRLAAIAPRRDRWPLVASALLFALAHASHGPDPIPLFVLALGLGYLYRQTHRLLPCVVVHFCLNACTLALMWLAVHSPEAGSLPPP